MAAMPSYNTIVVDLAALRHNYGQLRARVGDGVRVMAIVKANAYGHGLVPAAKAFQAAGARTFGVAEVEEGVRLREAGLDGDIVILLGAPQEAFRALVRHRLTPVVFSRHGLAALSRAAVAEDTRIGVHLKVDVGMGRLGVMPEEAGPLAQEIARLPGVSLAGLLSHFPLADADSEATLSQWQRFQAVRRQVEALAPGEKIVHIANSAAALRYSQTHAAMVRPGIALYGHYPAEGGIFQGVALKPAMAFQTRVIQVKEVPAGHGVSYGHGYVTKRPAKLAVLPVGYDNGYLRGLTGKAQVLIRGQRVPVVGVICMNVCMAEVTGLPAVRPGDEVTLMGRQGEASVTAEEIAAWMGTINYEVLCLFGSRNRQVHIDTA